MTRSVANEDGDNTDRQRGPLSTFTGSLSLSTIRSISLLSSFIVALSAGSNYGFSSYSPQLQERLHLSSTQINIVGVMGNMGVYLSGPFWGRLVDRKGPKIALALGASLVVIGYGGLSISYRSTFWSSTSLFALSIFSLFSGLGNSAAFTAAMNAQAKSWGEERRGLCTALVLSGFGLSAFFYSTLSHTLFPGKTGDYLLLLAFGSSFSFLIGLAFIKILPPDLDHSVLPSDAGEMGTRRRVPSQVIADAERSEDGLYVRPSSSYSRRRTSSDIGGRAYAFAQDANSDEDNSEDAAYSYGDRADSVTRRNVRAQEQQGLLQGGREANGSRSVEEANNSRKDELMPEIIDKTGRKLLKDVDFLILFAIMTIISGTGLLVINNIGTMTRTLYEYNKKKNKGTLLEVVLALDLEAMRQGDVQQLQAHQVSAISIGNALGRILMGLMSDLVVNRTGDARNRVFLLLLVCLLGLISQGAAAWPNIISDLKKLFGMSIVTGLMYGTLFGLCPVLTFEWFGLRHFSQNWGIISLSPVIAGNIFNLLFGKIYDSHVPKDSPSHFCPDGEECFRSVFRFTVIGAILATFLSIIIIGRRAGWRKPGTAQTENPVGA